MRFCVVSLAGVFLGLSTNPAIAQEKPLYLRGARIHRAAGTPIDNGVLVIHKGMIVDVGPADKVAVPDGAETRNLSGKVIIPGLVDTHSHIGISSRPYVPGNSDGNEGSGPVQPALRALDAILPSDPGIRMARAGGVTTANIMPGSGNVIGGQTLYVKLRGNTVEDMRVEGNAVGGLKMANGENPKRFNFEGKRFAPATRMKLAALQREQFVKAREYKDKWVAYRKSTKEGKEASPPERDIALEPLVEVLEKKRTVHFHCHRADDIMSAARLSREFDFDLVLQHGTEAYVVAEELAQMKASVSLTLVDSPGGKLEVAGLLEENAAILDKAGIRVAINTDDSVTESRFFLRTGSIAVRGGMSEDAAIRALTIHGAQMLKLDHRLGSLEKGKDADFVVLSGPPFSVYSQVLETYIDGEKFFDRARERDWPYQVGGFAVAERESLPKPASALTPATGIKSPSIAPGTTTMKEYARRFAVYAGRVHTVSKGAIDDGVILVEDGVIKQVERRADFKLPDNTPVLTAAVVTPGLIDAHTVVGLAGALNIGADQDNDEISDPNQADLRVLDGFNPNEALLEYLKRQGITVVHAMPGRANVFAGQTGVFRTQGRTAEEMALRFPAGVLINLGEAPKDTYKNRQPTTRMGTAALVRQSFVQAQDHARKRSAGGDKKPATNAKLDPLVLAMEGKLPVLFNADRRDDINTALRLSAEFKLKASIHQATDAYLTMDTLKKAGVSVVVHPTMQRAASMETYNSHLGNAATLVELGIPVAIGSGNESYVPKTRVVRMEAAMAMVNGLGTERALCAITLDAARILGIDDKYGSLEVGKPADIVLYDGDPFEHATHVTHTIIGGRVVWDRAEYLKLPFARRALPLIGGAGVGCCLGW